MTTIFSNLRTSWQSQADGPRFQCLGYREMEPMWNLIEDLAGGTLAMRAAGTKWLPKEEEEDDRHFQIRLQRSVLYNGFTDTVDKLAARPFSKPITIKSDTELPEQLSWLIDDCDKQGTSLTKFCHQMFRDGVAYGLAHAIVDYSRVEQGTTLDVQRKEKLGPYFVRICPTELFFWHDVNGKLLKLRYLDCRTEPDGKFGQKVLQTVVEWTETAVTTYVLDVANDLIGKTVPHTLGRIPLFTFYTKKTGFLTAKPPMEDLAWMNVAHWQSYSDQRNILRYARLGLLFMSGVTPSEVEKATVIAANRVIKSANAEAKMMYVEHNGKAIGAGHTDVLSIEEKMLVLGMQPLFETSGTATATGRAMDESRSQSLAQCWVIEFEETLEAMFEFAAEIAKVTLDPNFAIVIDKEFSLSMKAGLDVQALIALRAAGEIDRKTLLEELKRRSVLADTTEITEVIRLAKEEGPSINKLPANSQEQKNKGKSKEQASTQDSTTSNPGGL